MMAGALRQARALSSALKRASTAFGKITQEAGHGHNLDELQARFARAEEVVNDSVQRAVTAEEKALKAAMKAAQQSLKDAKRRQDRIGTGASLSKKNHLTTAFEHYVKSARAKNSKLTLKALSDKWRKMTEKQKLPYFKKTQQGKASKQSKQREKQMTTLRPKEVMDEFKQYASRVMPDLFNKARAEGLPPQKALEAAMKRTKALWAEEQKPKKK